MGNREIKFRGWDERAKLMHEDFRYIKSGDEGNDWIIFTSSRQTLQEKHHPFENPYFQEQFKIMQYTGLKDANSVEIYEGDIVAQEWIKKDRYDSGEFVYGVIKFVGCCFVEAYKISERQEDVEKIDGENCIVVGNIYQNQELLNG